MEIIKNFGIDPLLLIAQIVNFLIIFYILKRFALKPILDILKKRENTIKEGLREAEEGKKVLEEAYIKEKEILKKAQSRSEKIIEDTQIQALEIIKGAEEKTKKQTELMLISAKEQMEKESKETEKRIAMRVSDMALDFLEKSLKNLFGEKEQKQLMQIAIKKIKKSD
ncbi:MAG: hypothetical protein A2958_03270 [Candidatus Levybacteria bacterium RIFCSPLOWO2_01_FULL_38_13]|nr:MAG: hypothetical protein A2629_03685 [Candidatus Levybacteria bacterium RIFCSPHIGHO2_01_FULL_41_15]OGH35335.1 MAG: hypothetical protein A2958_03270 [Candidatus Levybacteria bacterium RIFCSPLOWO2_01_FULL_38_13]